MHRGLRSGPRMGELFQGQDGSLWRSVGPLEVGAALAGRDEEEVYRDPCAAASAYWRPQKLRAGRGSSVPQVGQTMAGQYRADHSPWLKASVPCKWSQVEASGLPHHIIPTLFYFSTAKFSGFDFSPKQKVFSKKKSRITFK